MKHLVFFASVLLAIPSAHAAEGTNLLSRQKINEAVVFYQEKLNNGLPFVGGGVRIDLESGDSADHHEIRMLAEFLHLRKELPALAELLPLLEHPNMACRVFCRNCLKLTFKDLPNYSPFYPPGSEPQQIAKVRAGVSRQIEISRMKAAGPLAPPSR